MERIIMGDLGIIRYIGMVAKRDEVLLVFKFADCRLQMIMVRYLGYGLGI